MASEQHTIAAGNEPEDKSPKHGQHHRPASHTHGHQKPDQLLDTATKDAAEVEQKLPETYSKQRHCHHQSAAAGRPTPTIYTPDPQIRGSPALPPPRRPTEREGTDGLAGGGQRKIRRLPFASLRNCGRKGKVLPNPWKRRLLGWRHFGLVLNLYDNELHTCHA
jgi:hypothetical protein